MGVKTERFKLSGVTHYKDNIEELLIPNEDYKLPKRELAEIYSDWEKIWAREPAVGKVELIPEPDNPYDKNAVRVDMDGLTVGYIKKGSCSHAKNLLSSPDFVSVDLDYIHYGKYKTVFESEEGKYELETGEYESPSVAIVIKTRTADEEETPKAKAPEIQTPITPPPVTETEIQRDPFTPTPAQQEKPVKQKTYPKGMYIFMLIFSIVFLLFSLMILMVDQVSGLVLLVITALLFLMNRHFRKKYPSK